MQFIEDRKSNEFNDSSTKKKENLTAPAPKNKNVCPLICLCKIFPHDNKPAITIDAVPWYEKINGRNWK